MLWNFFVLILLWIIAVVNSYTIGGLVHLLPVLAVISVAREFIRARRERITI